MNIITLNKDVSRVESLLESGNKKALEDMLRTFLNSYKITLYSKLNPFNQKKWNDIFISK